MIHVRDFEVHWRYKGLYIEVSDVSQGYNLDTVKIDPEDAAALWPILKHFAETGRLPLPEETEQ